MSAGAVVALATIAQAFATAFLLNALIVERPPREALMGGFFALAVAVAVRVGAAHAADRLAFTAGLAAVRALRSRLLDGVAAAGPVALALRAPGEIVALIAGAARAVEPFYSRYQPARLEAALLPLAIFLVLVPLDWRSGVVLLVTAPLIPLFMVLIGKGAEALNRRQWAHLQRMSGHFLDMVQGLATLKALNGTGRAERAVADAAQIYRRDTMVVLRVAFLSALTLEFFATVSIAMLAVLIGFRLMWGDIGYRDGLFILLLAPEFYLPLRAMGTAYHARMEALGAADRLAEFLHALEQVPRATSGTIAPPPGPAEIVFEDVHLAYPDGRQALSGVNFHVAPGACTALVGPSGAGKSSLLTLLLGFAAPQAGQIRIGGVPLEQIDMAAWRACIAYVPQRPVLLAASVAANIAPGEDAPDPARLRAAAEAAGIARRIEHLPQGFATRIGEGGHSLSGGEAHRIALARAFYRKAALVLLDEPTAHLDPESAAAVRAAVTAMTPASTLVMIAHHPDMQALAHRVVALSQGRVAREEAR